MFHRTARDVFSLCPAGYAMACAAAAFVGWAVWEPFFQDGGSAARVGVANAFLCPTLLGLISAAFVFVDSARWRDATESFLLALSGFGVVFAASFALMVPSQLAFSWFSGTANAVSGFDQESELVSILTGRAISWGMFSAGIIGTLIVSRRRGIVLAAVAGSLVSGIVSGLLFDPIQILLSGQGMKLSWLSRMICFAILGGMTGFFLGAAQGLSRTGLLLITTGPLAGHRLVLDSAPCTIGASSDCDFIVPSAGLPSFSAVIHKAGFGFRLQAIEDDPTCSVNNRKIRSATLRAGDCVRIGELDMVFSIGK
jgi:hypothetical protein